MTISIIYHVSHTLPSGLALYLSEDDSANRAFESDMMRAYSGNVSSGSNAYSDREDWAEFTSQREAENADRVARHVIKTYHNNAIRKGY